MVYATCPACVTLSAFNNIRLFVVMDVAALHDVFDCSMFRLLLISILFIVLSHTSYSSCIQLP